MTIYTHDTGFESEHSTFKLPWTDWAPSPSVVLTGERLSIAAQATVASAIGASVTGVGLTNNRLPFVNIAGDGVFIGLSEQLLCSGSIDLEAILENQLYGKSAYEKASIIYSHGLIFAASEQAMLMVAITGWPESEFDVVLGNSDGQFWPTSYLRYMRRAIQADSFDLGLFSDRVANDSFAILTRNWHLVCGAFNRLSVEVGGFQPFPFPNQFGGFWEAQLNPEHITREMSASAWGAGLESIRDRGSIPPANEKASEEPFAILFKECVEGTTS